MKCHFHKPCGAYLLGGIDICSYLCHSFFILQVMTDYEYIIKQAKMLYYTQWSEEELRKCVDMLPALEREELVSLCHCKWIKKVMEAQNYLFSYARTKIQ